ncbi:bacteriocin-like peptide BlpJ [Streptococcus pneumoniae]|uniref:Bacteriocin BlpJ n=1 Tax=Streptococcus pneumoniae TaxID=1313 RepID=A0AAI9A2L7_STREE|nr:bacteriocin-like peptide BlpJ [Streptococcus pneumoniae]MDG7178339.1 bacteriocin-like peptide BlpJ [Streptococcus pneumoniae]MDG7528564.1 bacteriocin-like peptide BlpJ [Streptococcus pneumoniae]MDG7676623.1 bacteriocin-like peptide BlpJ [Streptococcus pneumoniae]MDG7903096.1 bacteriocin-like peptide BlpJ [Streptococcus pneumoniae]MDG8077374.1 bacteriocin-like peptide BlpJ [Streptococcus pneumoniae]
MNTKMLSQLEVMDTEMLAKVEGGYSFTDCQNALITGVTTGIITGGTGAGLATLGVAGLAGAFVGAHIGAIGGGLTCLGGMVGDKLGLSW